MSEVKTSQIKLTNRRIFHQQQGENVVFKLVMLQPTDFILDEMAKNYFDKIEEKRGRIVTTKILGITHEAFHAMINLYRLY